MAGYNDGCSHVFTSTCPRLVELLETDLLSTLTETTTAQHQTILANQTVVVGTAAALARASTEAARVGEPDVLVNHCIVILIIWVQQPYKNNNNNYKLLSTISHEEVGAGR